MSEQVAQPGTSGTRRAGLWLRLAYVACVGVALLAVVLFVVGLPLYYTLLSTPCPNGSCQENQLTVEQIRDFQASGLSLDVYVAWRMAATIILVLLSYTIVGLILWHRPNDPMALFVATMGIVGSMAEGPISITKNVSPILYWVVSFMVLVHPFFIYSFFFLFPDGRFVPRWTRWLLPALLVFLVRPLVSEQVSGLLFLLFVIVWIPIGIYAQIYRYRRVSTTAQRQQAKWAMFGYAGTMIGVLSIAIIIVTLPEYYRPGSLGQIVLDTAFYVVASLIPLSLGLAILRYRLYDIDIIIRRTLVYSTLTLTLGLVYVGSILVSRTLVAPLTGGSELAIVVSTLAIAALFIPLRRRIQTIIDRRFYRRKYDATKVLAAFGATARDETDLERLTSELLRVVDETMQPEFVGLWLRDPQARSTTEATQPGARPPR